MGVKKNNLDRIIELRLNVHEYKLIDNIDELIEYSNLNNKFSIRFDSIDGRHGLPFYTYDSNRDDKNILFKNIIDEMNILDCKLLVSNGYMYDDNIKFNFVIDIKDNNDFIFELCSKKVPLRNMYDNNITTIITGNLFDDYNDYTITNKDSNIYNEKDIEKIINLMINNMSIKYIEGTIYDREVGILNKDIVIWQVA